MMIFWVKRLFSIECLFSFGFVFESPDPKEEVSLPFNFLMIGNAILSLGMSRGMNEFCCNVADFLWLSLSFYILSSTASDVKREIVAAIAKTAFADDSFKPPRRTYTSLITMPQNQPATHFFAGLTSRPHFYYFVVITVMHLLFIGAFGFLHLVVTAAANPSVLVRIGSLLYPLSGLIEFSACFIHLPFTPEPQKNGSGVFIISMIINSMMGIFIYYWIDYGVFMASKICWLATIGFMIGWLKSDLCSEIVSYIMN
jgi:hypothetical protein